MCPLGMRTLILSLSALLCSGFLSSLTATSIAEPENMEVKSPNGKYVLKVDSKTGVHQLCEADPKNPERSKVIWQFHHQVWHNDYFVSDDGKHVLWVAWKYVKESQVKRPAVVVFSVEGKALSKSYAEASTPREYGKFDKGPIGDFWRIWRESKIERKGERVTIPVAGKAKFVVDLSDPIKATK